MPDQTFNKVQGGLAGFAGGSVSGGAIAAVAHLGLGKPYGQVIAHPVFGGRCTVYKECSITCREFRLSPIRPFWRPRAASDSHLNDSASVPRNLTSSRFLRVGPGFCPPAAVGVALCGSLVGTTTGGCAALKVEV
jgi:hypothetical protein